MADDELDKTANILYKWEYTELTEEDEDKRLEEELGKDDDDNLDEDEEPDEDKLFEEEAGKEEDDFTEDEDNLTEEDELFFDEEEDFRKDEELGFDSLDSATSEELETSTS